jgi:hypothetical protein
MANRPETNEEIVKRLNAKLVKALIGRKIVEARYTTGKEAADIDGGCFCRGVVLYLDDGTEIMPMGDPEGNDAGTLFIGCEIFGPLPPERRPDEISPRPR